MNDHNQKLEATRFDLGSAPAPETDPSTPERKPALEKKDDGPSRNTLIALGVLVLAVVLVFLWLPSLVSEPEVEIARPDPATTAIPQGPQLTPWSDAQLQRQRKEAQDILALLLEEQFALEELGAEQWAPEAFQAAVDRAGEADALYRQQQFLEATEAYQDSLDQLLALSRQVPEIFEQHLQRGLEALENGEPEIALAQLQLAQLINPDSGEVAHALGRAQNLAPVLALLEEAAAAVRNSELNLAENLLKEAKALDPEHNQVKAELVQVQRDIARRDFNRAMTLGYDALDSGDFDKAEDFFRQARRIMPSAPETESAISQARDGRTRAQIDLLAGKASAAERSENWDIAVQDYQSILNIDDTVVFARSGMIRSKTRADLDKRMQRIINEPQRLQDQSIYKLAQQTWREAASLNNPGSKLKKQLEEVRALLTLAKTPIPVLLQSDELTEVTVYRVAKLGTFRRQQLELKPGTYTAVGVRNGYRDVRKKFTVQHGQTNPVIEISCTEPI